MKKKIFIKILTVGLLLTIVSIACKKEPVQYVTIERSLSILAGETVTLSANVYPANAHNKNVSWESDNPNVATVDNKGNVTGKTLGRAEIKVITEDGGFTATCYVSVSCPIEPEEMIWVEGGTFMMGCNHDECIDFDLPSHEVTLNGFYISKYVVTVKEWNATIGNSYYTTDNMPAWMISWDEVQLYISKLNDFTGKNYRLPTEAEWEYAARGGNKSQGYKFSGSNNIGEVAWYYQNAGLSCHPVGKKKPNELGLYDMSGNLPEWCSDYSGSYTDEPQMNPTGPDQGTRRIARGGGWWFNYPNTYGCTVSCRWHNQQNIQIAYGFRLVHP